MATVKDIAKIAGVSTATVSRALAAPEKVAESTRKKVEDAAKSVGYSPNAMARSLRTNETKTVVVVVPNLSNPFFSDIINGMEEFAHRCGYKVLIGDANNDNERIQNYFDLVDSKLADGVLLLTSEVPITMLVDEFGEARFPMVVASEYFKEISLPTVHIDNDYSAAKAIEYLIVMGHYKIACISGPLTNPLSTARLQGQRNCMAKWKLPVEEEWILEGDFSFYSGYSLGQQLLISANRPTAIFCHSDEMAIGVLKVAKEMNIAVPAELTVVGFDNIVYGEYCDPKLTTVHQPRELIGETAMKLLLDILAGKKPNPEMTLPTQLIVRDSSAPPPIEHRLKVDL